MGGGERGDSLHFDGEEVSSRRSLRTRPKTFAFQLRRARTRLHRTLSRVEKRLLYSRRQSRVISLNSLVIWISITKNLDIKQIYFKLIFELSKILN